MVEQLSQPTTRIRFFGFIVDHPPVPREGRRDRKQRRQWCRNPSSTKIVEKTIAVAVLLVFLRPGPKWWQPRRFHQEFFRPQNRPISQSLRKRRGRRRKLLCPSPDAITIPSKFYHSRFFRSGLFHRRILPKPGNLVKCIQCKTIQDTTRYYKSRSALTTQAKTGVVHTRTNVGE